MISPTSLAQAADYLAAERVGRDGIFTRVCSDSRCLAEGDLYVALVGDRHDGHQFVRSAMDAGAVGAVVSRAAKLDPSIPQIKVSNTQQAYGLLGQMNRRQFAGQVCGITGSSGKTTTKNMLKAILSEAGPTLATEGNFNNEIGVPRTLLSINQTHQYAVVELGARKPGDIAYIAGLTEPDVAILTNAGESHLGIFGSYENIVATKGEIYDAVRKGGVCIVNADDPAATRWQAERASAQFVRFALRGSDADIFARNIKLRPEGSSFILELVQQGTTEEISLNVAGKHNIANALAASAAALAMGLSLAQIKSGLAQVQGEPGRAQRLTLGELTVLDETYNANPSSVRAALENLAIEPGLKVAVLGTMAELGAEAETLHLSLAKSLGRLGLDLVILMGEFAEAMAGACSINAQVVHSHQQAAACVLEQKACCAVLVKGSRCMGMEEIVEIIKKDRH